MSEWYDNQKKPNCNLHKLLNKGIEGGARSCKLRAIVMKLAVRASKVDAVKLQLQSSLELQEVNIIAAPTNYAGITLLDLDESAVSTLSSIRNIEALLLDEEAAAKLKQSSKANETISFKSLDGVDEREQYEHLSQLLHIQKAPRDKR